MLFLQIQSEDLGTEAGAAASNLVTYIEEWFAGLNLNETVASILAVVAALGCMFLLCILAYSWPARC